MDFREVHEIEKEELIHKTYRFRIYPNHQQEQKINQTLGAVRYIYNYFLKKWDTCYHETGRGLNFAYCCAQLPEMKRHPETYWLGNVDSTALQMTIKQLSDAFIYFYKYHSRFPMPKTKNDYYQRFSSKQVGNNIRIHDRCIRIPKIGWIRMKKSQDVAGYITHITVTKEVTGRYYLSVMVKSRQEDFLQSNRIVSVVPVPDGSFFTSNEKYYRNSFVTSEWVARLKRMEDLQEYLRKLAVQRGESLSQAKNYQKQVKKVARMYSRLEGSRKDFLHKMTSELVRDYGVICLPKFSDTRGIGDVFWDKRSGTSWSELIHMLKYKCHWKGRIYYMIPMDASDRTLPYSQLAKKLYLRAEKLFVP